MKKIEKIDHASFALSEIVDVKFMGNVLECSKINFKPSRCPIKILDGYYYCLLETGEVLAFKENIKGRLQHVNSLYRTFKNIREVINTNIIDVSKVRWITLTYAENMQDTNRLRTDFKAFNKRFKRFCVKNSLGDYEYINVVEPQARGAWHHHLFMIFDEVAPYIPNAVLSEIWGHGFVVVKGLDDIDNIGAYFSAYLSDIPIDDVRDDSEFRIVTSRVEIIDKKINGEDKKIIKGGRLSYYPKGFRILRTSRGIKRPEVEVMTYREFKNDIKKEGLGEPSFSRTMNVIDLSSGKQVNSYRFQHYNILRH